ncbi:aldehyde dehydrogenase [Croceicoccus bisphenolivorans]|uniref:aldehyde dehydrogenase n=1 Tax=Croceicoccus bisphenolivorans TaxID=1783232 RepID=UPI00083409D7|nr:aldehyde dehydrogenase [Croceicoccus bisphenolivorans]
MLDRFDPAELSENVRSRFYIGGQWVSPRTDARLDLISPLTEQVQFSVPAAAPEDMDAAVSAASEAFENGPWPRLTPAERARYLIAMGQEVEKRLDLFKRVWTAQVGVVNGFSGMISGLIPHYFTYFAGLAETYPFEEDRPTPGGRARVIREPVGVCALILPWNSPLILLVAKLCPALLAGCTVVAKPSPETPLDALILAECADAVGLPPGVFNVVPADREAGDHLICDRRIDKVSFTGSTAAGRHIGAVCADRVARYSLELGGKSAAIICEDADLAAAIPAVTPVSMPFSGQICFAQTRMLVPERRKDEVVDAYRAAVESIKVGDPWEDDVGMGPLAMRRQQDRVFDYLDIGRKEGARIVTGGGRGAFNSGFFVQPTIFDGVTPDMRIAQEEIFGPVVSIIAYRDEEEAIRIANDSNFGLSGTVFTPDLERGENIARRVRTGNISVNGLQLDPSVPFGGFKQSGLGREGGPEGLEAYLEIKSIYLPA